MFFKQTLIINVIYFLFNVKYNILYQATDLIIMCKQSLLPIDKTDIK